MKKLRFISMAACIVVAAVMLAGCGASYQARSVEMKKSVLVNPEVLTKGTGDQSLYRYMKPNFDIKQYTKVLIDPVLVKKDGELSKEELADYQKLANNAFVYLTQELQKDYTVVTAPEAGAMRIQMAIVDADSTSKVSNTLSTFSPPGIVINLIKYSATGKQIGVGEVTVEMRITDAATGELLAAALDRRVGGKDVSELWSSWYSVDEALKYWAKKVAYVACDMRGATNCVKPE